MARGRTNISRVQQFPGTVSLRTTKQSVGDIVDELKIKIGRDMRRRKGPKEFAERVAAHARAEAPSPTHHHPLTKTGPYATGAFAASIKVRQTRRGRGLGGGQFMPTFEVYTNSPIAHFLEYGTKEDKPDSKSPWGPNTPTPEFAIFAKTAHFFGGTPD